MIIRYIYSNNLYIKDHILYFRSLLNYHRKSYNNLLLYSSYRNIFNNFNTLINLTKVGINVVDFKVIKNRCFNCLIIPYNDYILNYYTIIDFTIINSYYCGTLRRKLMLFSLPCITINCSYIINNIERVVISQVKKKSSIIVSLNKPIYFIKIKPFIGPSIKFKVINYYYFYIYISSVKYRLSKFISILQLSLYKLYSYLLSIITIMFNGYTFMVEVNINTYINKYLDNDLYNLSGILVYKKGLFISNNLNLTNNIYYYYLNSIYYNSLVLSNQIEINSYIFKRDTRINLLKIRHLVRLKILYFKVYNYTNIYINNYLLKLLSESTFYSKQDKYNLIKCFNTDIKISSNIKLYNILFNSSNYQLSINNRTLLNKLLRKSTKSLLFNKSDIYLIISKLIYYCLTNKTNNNIDNLDYKVFNSVGNYLLILLRGRLIYLFKSLSRRINLPLNIIELNTNIPSSYITDYIKEFYCISPYSQFLDQINQLSELTHKRRFTNLYNINVRKGSVSINLRNINQSYYGRVCPIETPEGKSIGLINSLSSFVKVSRLGILKAPYINTNNNINYNLYYYNIILESKYILTDNSNNLINQLNNYGRYIYKYCNKFIINNYFKSYSYLTLVTSIQLFSLAPLMIPFMNHNDGNRVLMGSNMHRQAIPCILLNIPYISTGIEYIPSINLLNTKIMSIKDKCEYYDSYNIVLSTFIRYTFIIKIYRFKKYISTNQNTYFNQKLSLKPYSLLPNRLLLNDTNDTINGLLSLGQNLLTVFTPWRGYNFEDSIIISDRVARSDNYCSIHIYNYESIFLNNPDGLDIIDKNIYIYNIPNIKYIDNDGIIKLGSIVKPNDILICKLKLKLTNYINNSINQTSLLYNKNDVEEHFLKVPLGINGKVINIEIINCLLKTRVNRGIYSNNISTITLTSRLTLKLLLNYLFYKYKYIYINISYSNNRFNYLGYNKFILYNLLVINNRLLIINNNRFSNYKYMNYCIKKVIITLSVRKYLQVGDKMSGRHGNKGVVSKILPIEDMPYLSDGTPCDLILNPLSITSRMNIGQLFELKLGLIVFFLFKRIKYLIVNNNYNKLYNYIKCLGFNFTYYSFKYFIKNYRKLITISTIPFEGINYTNLSVLIKLVINKYLINKYKLCSNYETMVIYDGLTGKPFNNKLSIGYLYFYKLYHLATDKVHARSIGPYSLITQQPLKGRSNYGGQRFGEMEVWALEAYGSSFILFELLNLKSDIIQARDSLYNSLVFGTKISILGLSESLKALLKELMSFGLNIELI